MNETVKAIYDRKSVRVFTEQTIDEDIKRTILEAAIQAPSAGNMQMWSIIDVTDQELKEQLAESCDHQPFIATAPLVLVFCADMQKWFDAWTEAGCNPRELGVGDMLLSTTDTMIAAQNAVVAAESFGIGSCYIGDILENKENVTKLLNLPKYVMPVGMVVFGYPTKQQKERPKPTRPAVEHIVMENVYQRKDGEALRALYADKTANTGFDNWMKAFCDRKFNSEFSREMTRSVQEYIKNWQ